MPFVDPSIGFEAPGFVTSPYRAKAPKLAFEEKGGRSMTYPLNQGLFIENGAALTSAEARRRRATAEAFYRAEQARLSAARTVTGAEMRVAA
jgi:hypothetical protein